MILNEESAGIWELNRRKKAYLNALGMANNHERKSQISLKLCNHASIINPIKVMKCIGFPVAPKDAHPKIEHNAEYILFPKKVKRECPGVGGKLDPILRRLYVNFYITALHSSSGIDPHLKYIMD